ncbi:hypothetical protein [Tsukamurella ocularis]|uniref:hypothetical protein n=1 Tax=Tsukamurella ocularis TaxID=1970234 RepID=UPI0021693499|nr:hypothetical protein [Tsukamurella ocularis]MCS3779520.1 hypothetical protein [Tsukamurella ocularis]MCS3788007.1 hypothetical protein [Tsukamurella ocularis]MCS3852323.1 hypothetical protein [Tsukamurella ocularis]
MTDNADQIPAVTIEWTALPGDARRATLSVLRQRRFWVRSLVIGLVVGVIVAAVCIATGSGWHLGLLIGGCFFLGLTLEVVLVCMFSAYRHNRKGLAAGARWAAGSDATRIRIENPLNTILLDRANVESVERNGALAVLTVRPKQRLGIPVALLPALRPDSATPDLID